MAGPNLFQCLGGGWLRSPRVISKYNHITHSHLASTSVAKWMRGHQIVPKQCKVQLPPTPQHKNTSSSWNGCNLELIRFLCTKHSQTHSTKWEMVADNVLSLYRRGVYGMFSNAWNHQKCHNKWSSLYNEARGPQMLTLRDHESVLTKCPNHWSVLIPGEREKKKWVSRWPN